MTPDPEKAQREMPRWLQLQFEIDMAIWQLNELRRELAKPVSPLAAMIDEATGRWETEAAELMARISSLRSEFDSEVSS